MSWTKLLPNILLVTISLSIGLLCAELVLRVALPQNLSGSWRMVDPSGLVLNKTSGKAQHQLGDTIVQYRFGEFHNRMLANSSANEHRDRILVLGDSFTFGWLLADGKTYVDRLQQAFPSKMFINAAAGGWGTADHAKYIELFCTQIHPKLIVIFLNTDDIGRAYRSPLYKLENGKLVQGDPPRQNRLKTLLNSLPLYSWLLEHSHLVTLVRQVFLSDLVVRGKEASKEQKFEFGPTTLLANPDEVVSAVILGKKLFQKIKIDTENCGADLKVFYTGWASTHDPINDLDPTMVFLREAKHSGFFAHARIDYIDLTDTESMQPVYKDRKSHTVPGDGHPNAKGAEAIYSAVREKFSFSH